MLFPFSFIHVAVRGCASDSKNQYGRANSHWKNSETTQHVPHIACSNTRQCTNNATTLGQHHQRCSVLRRFNKSLLFACLNTKRKEFGEGKRSSNRAN